MAEILVVTALLGIAAGVVIPHIGSNPEQHALAAARSISQDILYAQDVAVTTQSPVTLSFSTSGYDYSIQDSSGALLTHPITRKPFTVNFLDDPHISQVNIQVDFGQATEVVFDALGTPSAGGMITLSHPSMESDVIVTLYPATGNVTVTSP